MESIKVKLFAEREDWLRRAALLQESFVEESWGCCFSCDFVSDLLGFGSKVDVILLFTCLASGARLM